MPRHRGRLTSGMRIKTRLTDLHDGHEAISTALAPLKGSSDL